MEEESEKKAPKKSKRLFWTTVGILFLVLAASLLICYQVVRAEAYARYVGILNVSAEKIAKTVRGVEMNAQNIFGEVGKNLDSPETVRASLEREANLNLDVRGYFAAFEPGFFPEQGTWYEPYIYQPDEGGFEYRQVGSARHNYHKSPWYVRAKATGQSFWSDPYYYYDGTPMSGHYCTFIKPVYDEDGYLACVCGADMKFEWLAKDLEWEDQVSKKSSMVNKFQMITDFDYYTVILHKDGTCLASPPDKEVKITSKDVLKALTQREYGEHDMNVNGVACTVYYGPIEFIDWSVAVVVPKKDLLKPMVPIGLVLLSVFVAGVLLLWFVYRRSK